MSYIQNINRLFEPHAQSTSASRSKPHHPNPHSILPPKHISPPPPPPRKPFIPSPKYQYQYRNDLSQQYQIGQDIVKVLRQENLNLKEQNNFLIQKLRVLAEKEDESTELSMRHQQILQDLKLQNVQLKKELRYMNQLASSKVQEFGKKLAQITRQSQQQIASQQNISLRDLNPPAGVLGMMKSVQSDEQKFTNSTTIINNKNNRFHVIMEKPSFEERMTEDSGKTLDDLKNQFDAILYSCKVEKDNQKRKGYRKRLIELTNQMKVAGKRR